MRQWRSEISYTRKLNAYIVHRIKVSKIRSRIREAPNDHLECSIKDARRGSEIMMDRRYSILY